MKFSSHAPERTQIAPSPFRDENQFSKLDNELLPVISLKDLHINKEVAYTINPIIIGLKATNMERKNVSFIMATSWIFIRTITPPNSLELISPT